MIIGLGLGAFLLLLAAGAPVFIAMAISSLGGNIAVGGFEGALLNLAQEVYNSLDSFTLLAVPLYVMAGCLLEATDLSRKLFDFAGMLCSGLRGGLGVATIVACSIFAAISGSSVATAATVGLIALPVMGEFGYAKGTSGALVAAGGTLGILIPPSIPFIIFGLATGQSIGALFIAGVLPGVLLAVLMAIYTSVTSKVPRKNVSFSWAERLAVTRRAAAVLGLPVLVFVGIYTGIATVTEVAAAAVFYVLMVGLLTRTLSVPRLTAATLSALKSTVMIFVLVGFGTVMTKLFVLTGVPQGMASALAQAGLSPLLVFTLMVVLYLILGMFLEAISMMIITVPILYPIATAIGIPPLAFGVIVVLAVEAAQITPPVGVNLFTICKVGNVRFDEISRSILPYVALLILMMYLVFFAPQLATWLPSTMNYGQ